MAPPPRAGGALRQSLPARLFLLSAGFLASLLLVGRLIDLPAIAETFRRVVALALLAASVWLAALAIVRDRRRFLWRVRRKLILSYVFLGVVPVVLVATFALAGGVVVYNNVAAYLFREGVRDLEDHVRQAADLIAIEIAGPSVSAQGVLDRIHPYLTTRSAAVSAVVLAVPPPSASSGAPAFAPPVAEAGPWRHAQVPSSAPTWIDGISTFTGLVRVGESEPAVESETEPRLAVRAVARTKAGDRLVIVDLPFDAQVAGWLTARTGTTMPVLASSGPETAGAAGTAAFGEASGTGQGLFTLFRQTVVFVDYVADWNAGRRARTAIALDAPLSRLYAQLISAQPAELATALGGLWGGFILALVVLGVLFVIIQGSALVMGALLARSITSAVHELFVGTERVREGDFEHRIRIESRDQLGDLADSFNRMSGSIGHLLHIQREKQRLEDELRIAKEIQKSLLPLEPPRVPGLLIADFCEPAREVGGDYYDFFALGPRRLAVLVADVAGKGTSAALYMAELKGLLIALSRGAQSPKQLLTDLNRLLARQLDSRSFITMAYAIVDVETRTLTCARAGHTPIILVSGGRSEVLMPDGMVLGLQLPGAERRFEELLEERTRRLSPGDLVVLYTDGLTEAMDERGDLFGDAALCRVLTAHADLEPAAIRERVIREVKAFVGAAEPHDDLTLVILKMTEQGTVEAAS